MGSAVHSALQRASVLPDAAAVMWSPNRYGAMLSAFVSHPLMASTISQLELYSVEGVVVVLGPQVLDTAAGETLPFAEKNVTLNRFGNPVKLAVIFAHKDAT